MTKDELDAQIKTAVEAERARNRATNEARVKVRPLVGDVAMDSAEEIYRFALKQAGCETKVTDLEALSEMVDMAVANKNARVGNAGGGGIALDAAAVGATDLRQLFPGAT